MLRIALIGIALHLLISTASAQTATLKMQFIFDGQPPVQQNIGIPGRAPVVSEQLIVDPKNGGIKNICVYVCDQINGVPLKLGKEKPEKHILRIQNGRFAPHIVMCQVGDTLEVLNQEQVNHSVHIAFYNNPEAGVDLAPEQGHAFMLNSMEPSAIALDETLFPWMQAYVFALPHPFSATSGADGSLSIAGLPAHATFAFKCFHESASLGFKKIQVNGKAVTWKRNQFEVSLKPGINDLGVIRVPPQAFGL